jgi:hypothetical protein
MFDGSRNKSDVFIQEFSLYNMINRNHEVMRVPYNRVLMCLSYMKGPKVNDWVTARAQQLNDEMNAGGNPDDEAIWNDFKRLFLAAFTDTTKKEDAVQQLLNLKMTGDDLDSYISAFEHLALSAGWERNSQGTIYIFKKGLRPGLGRASIERTFPHPVTFDDWVRAAHRQHAAFVETRATYGANYSTPYNNPARDLQSRWRKALGGQNRGQQQRRRDPNAMDVDAAQMTPLSDKEREKLRAEGRCYFCKAQGHLSNRCPKKGGQPRTGPNKPRSQTTARVTETEGTETRDADNIEEAYQTLERLSKEDKSSLLDRMIVDDQDF